MKKKTPKSLVEQEWCFLITAFINYVQYTPQNVMILMTCYGTKSYIT